MNGTEAWNKTKEKLKNDLGVEIYENYIEQINNVYKETNNLIYLEVENPFVKSRVQSNFLVRMNAILSNFYQEPHYYVLMTKEEIAKERESKEKEGETIVFSKTNASNLNPNYTFSNFIVGDSNRLAHRYAMLAAEQLAGIASPIYIFGDVGLGKTHLMQAIGNSILESKPGLKVLYVRTQDFVEEYVKAGINNGYGAFSEKFSNIDVLLVDDVQFLESKKQCQLEFFKIFERLSGDQSNNKKLIVLTSDRRASDLTDIMARLTSRFEWGMSLDINRPDKTHRINILKSKLKQELPNPEIVPEDVIDYIATVCDSNIRVLESALKRVVFYVSAFDLNYSVDSAKEALKNLLESNDQIVKSFTPTHELKKMLDVVGAYFKIDQDDLLSSARKKEIVYARQLCWYIMRKHYDLTFQKIGDIFNGKDHSTVMHGYEVFESLVDSDDTTKKNVENVLRKMGKSSNEI